MYPEELVYPMRKQLTDQGFDELKSIDDVENMVSNKGTTLVVVNSVCGCAAANARPGAITSLVNDKKPDHLTTVFAGVDRDAVEKVRYYLAPFPPSSPAIALFKDGELVLVDAGCEYGMYASDITRTFPINGKFSAEQKAVYDLSLIHI